MSVVIPFATGKNIELIVQFAWVSFSDFQQETDTLVISERLIVQFTWVSILVFQ